jgi:integrase
MQNETRKPVLSGDGKWRSFPRTPNLLQYVSTGQYYGRLKVNGKIVRRRLKTDVISVAKLRLGDFIKGVKDEVGRPECLSFAEALSLFEQMLCTEVSLKPKTLEYYRGCVVKIKQSWPGIERLKLNEIKVDECRLWAKRLSSEISATFFNHTIRLFRNIVELGIEKHVEDGGVLVKNPGKALKRVRVKPEEPVLPNREQFRKLVTEIEDGSSLKGVPVSELIRFLAFSGTRAFSEAKWVTWEDVDWGRNEIVIRGRPGLATKNGELRRIPIISEMCELLKEMQQRRERTQETDFLRVHECQRSIDRASKKLGIARFTHHDLRHLFATRCIESGVDIPTVSRWLGHKDGGALAMKTYGHLRNEHSQQMAQKVKF